MRLFVPSTLALAAVWFLAPGAWTQTASSGGNMPQIPYGQTYRNFELPYYEGGDLKWKLSAASATGVSLNRAQVLDMTINVYENGKVTTTVTSPNADLYSSERRMRTKNTVRIVRADMEATAQRCDFNLISKQYVMTDNVRVILKHFDAASSLGTSGKAAGASRAAGTAASPSPSPAPPATAHGDDSLFDTPGAFSNSTNLGPISPVPPAKP